MTDMFRENLRELFASERERKGDRVTQLSLSRAIGKDRSYISFLCSGKSEANPTLKVVAGIAEQFGIEPWELLQQRGVGSKPTERDLYGDPTHADSHKRFQRIIEEGGDRAVALQVIMGEAPAAKKSNVLPMPAKKKRRPAAQPTQNFDEPQELREAQLPYYESIPAGKPGDVTPDDYYSTIGVLRNLAKPGRYVLKVDGDSMAPKIEDGDLVLVDTKPFPRSRQIVVALLNGEGTLKQLIRKKGQIILHPLNPEHKDIEIGEQDDLQIQGVVIDIVRRSL